MNAYYKIKQEIILQAIVNQDLFYDGNSEDLHHDLSEEIIDKYWGELCDKDLDWEYSSEFRTSGERTDLPCEESRHYESYSVARQLTDDSWVGWTYWYGGGKWGDPSGINWMEEAYFLDCTETIETVVVKHFTRKE